MKTKLSRKPKVLSMVLAVVMLVNTCVLPAGSVAQADANLSGTPPGLMVESGASTATDADLPPGSVDQITLPKTDKNPHSPSVSNDLYPILNDDGFGYLNGETTV